MAHQKETGRNNLRKERIASAVKKNISNLFEQVRFEDKKALDEAVESIRKMVWGKNHQNKHYPDLAVYFNTPGYMLEKMPDLSAEEKIHAKLQMMKALHTAIVNAGKHLGYKHEDRLWDEVSYTKRIKEQPTVTKKVEQKKMLSAAPNPLARTPALSTPVITIPGKRKISEVEAKQPAPIQEVKQEKETTSPPSTVHESSEPTTPTQQPVPFALSTQPVILRGKGGKQKTEEQTTTTPTSPQPFTPVTEKNKGTDDSALDLSSSPLPPSPPPPVRHSEPSSTKVLRFFSPSSELLKHNPDLQQLQQERLEKHRVYAAQTNALDATRKSVDNQIKQIEAESAQRKAEHEKEAKQKAAERTDRKAAFQEKMAKLGISLGTSLISTQVTSTHATQQFPHSIEYN